MDTSGLTGRLTEICSRRWYLRRFLEPLYRHAEQKGYTPLVRENALRLLEQAHVARLTGAGEAHELATEAMDRFETLARGGDPDAAFHLAEAHRTGFGRPRNHWKAVEHCRMAADLGHAGAPERLRQLEAREDVSEEHFDACARRALLKATYARQARGEHHARSLGAWAGEARREGIGLRKVLVLFGAAALIFGYVALDIYFSGMGAWRPDPTRVVWGIFGKIHPPKDDSAGRVLPGWLRPDARSVAFTVDDKLGGKGGGAHTLGDFRGQVVVLCVVDGRHPAPSESVEYMRAVSRLDNPGFRFFLLYIPGGEEADVADGYIQYAYDLSPGLPAGPKAFRPLGSLKTFPAFFIIDRKGRIRQRWVGFGQALTDAAIQTALAES